MKSKVCLICQKPMKPWIGMNHTETCYGFGCQENHLRYSEFKSPYGHWAYRTINSNPHTRITNDYLFNRTRVDIDKLSVEVPGTIDLSQEETLIELVQLAAWAT